MKTELRAVLIALLSIALLLLVMNHFPMPHHPEQLYHTFLNWSLK